MSNDNTQGNAVTSLWSRFTSWTSATWKNNKVAIASSAGAALLISSLAYVSLVGEDKQDTEQTEGHSIEQTVETVTTPVIKVDEDNNAVLIADETAPIAEEIDTVIDTPEEVLDLLNSLGLSDIFADEVERLSSDNLNVASQAAKDIGHDLANGINVAEDDSLANTFFHASYDMNANVQAAHSIGYQALHGLGMDGADLDLAEEMLSEANDNGHKLAAAHLDYLYQIK